MANIKREGAMRYFCKYILYQFKSEFSPIVQSSFELARMEAMNQQQKISTHKQNALMIVSQGQLQFHPSRVTNRPQKMRLSSNYRPIPNCAALVNLTLMKTQSIIATIITHVYFILNFLSKLICPMKKMGLLFMSWYFFERRYCPSIFIQYLAANYIYSMMHRSRVTRAKLPLMMSLRACSAQPGSMRLANIKHCKRRRSCSLSSRQYLLQSAQKGQGNASHPKWMTLRRSSCSIPIQM